MVKFRIEKDRCLWIEVVPLPLRSARDGPDRDLSCPRPAVFPFDAETPIQRGKTRGGGYPSGFLLAAGRRDLAR